MTRTNKVQTILERYSQAAKGQAIRGSWGSFLGLKGGMGQGQRWDPTEVAHLCRIVYEHGLVFGGRGPVAFQTLIDNGEMPEPLVARGAVACSRYCSNFR